MKITSCRTKPKTVSVKKAGGECDQLFGSVGDLRIYAKVGHTFPPKKAATGDIAEGFKNSGPMA